MRMRILLVFMSLVVVWPPASHARSGSITVPKKIEFKADTHVPDAVRKECDLEAKAAEAVRNMLTSHFETVTVADHTSSKTAGKALEMQITGLLAPGGGHWSGPKTVTITGTLWENGKALGNFTATRFTLRGRRTCDMLVSDVEEIGKDIAKWTDSPSKDALLGDAKK